MRWLARGRDSPCWREAARRPPGVTDEEHEEYERTVHGMLDALEAHAIKTGCDVTRFIVPSDSRGLRLRRLRYGRLRRTRV